MFSLWKCLHGNYNCSLPTKEHIFIVKYSWDNKIPILTTNFDMMFEDAARFLNIKYDVFLPDDEPPREYKQLQICKLHASISDKEGKISTESLYLTMTQICKMNTEWINFILQLMNNKNLCIVGYSGRDLDYFPFIANYSKNDDSKPIVWINKFSDCGYNSEEKANNCKSIKIPHYPKEYFPSVDEYRGLYQKIDDLMHELNQDKGDKVSEFNQNKRTSLISNLKNSNLLSEHEKSLFYAILLHTLGKYQLAYKQLIKVKKSINDNDEKKSYLILIKHLAQIHHEIGKYKSCSKYSTELCQNTKDENTKVIAKCLFAESQRMLVPNDLYFKYHKNYIDKFHFYSFSFYVLCVFLFVYVYVRVAQIFKSHNWSIDAKHEFIEHKIRLVSILMKLKMFGSIFNKMLDSWLNRLEKESYQKGYAAGIANAKKFQSRLYSGNTQNKMISEAKEVYSITTSSTGQEILLRTLAEQKLDNNLYDEARSCFLESIELSNKSGNIMNEIKAHIGLAYTNHRENRQLYLTNEQFERFKCLSQQVEGKLWKKYLSQLIVKFE